MNNQAQVSPELYEQVKAMVLEEIKATNRAKAKARQQAREEAWKQQAKTEAEVNEATEAALDQLKRKYVPLLAPQFEYTFMNGNKSLYEKIMYKLNTAINTALMTVGIYSLSGAYRLGKLDEVVSITSEILDATIQQTKQNKEK